MLVVAVDPSFFNNNQRAWQRFVFWRLRLRGVAGWLPLIQQAAAGADRKRVIFLLPKSGTASPSPHHNKTGWTQRLPQPPRCPRHKPPTHILLNPPSTSPIKPLNNQPLPKIATSPSHTPTSYSTTKTANRQAPKLLT